MNADNLGMIIVVVFIIAVTLLVMYLVPA